VIRGGAIGDFILTLPAVKALREAHPRAHLEILGYKHIAALAENRFYAQAVRSIESATLSSFFAKDAKLPSELSVYFASFDLILSYLYDPDQIFENNLRRCGVKRFLRGPGKIDNRTHAARQLTEPLLEIGIKVADLAAKIYPSAQDRHLAREFLEGCARPIVALHPGSGSETKNWPLQNWIDVGNQLFASEKFAGSILVISGEADEKQASHLQSNWRNERVRFAKNLPLPLLGALLEKTIFIGHDSGISHLAAAAGANCTLLFGPTDPAVWAPTNENVRTIRAASRRMEDVDLGGVLRAVKTLLR
jgi:heptosyltransferase-3